MQYLLDVLLALYLGMAAAATWLAQADTTCILIELRGAAGRLTLFAGPASRAPSPGAGRILELRLSLGPSCAAAICLLGASALLVGLPFGRSFASLGLIGLALYLMAANAAQLLHEGLGRGLAIEDELDGWDVLPSLVALPILVAGLRLA